LALRLNTAKDSAAIRFIVTNATAGVWFNLNGTSIETTVNNKNGKKCLRGKSPGQRGNSDSEQSDGEKVHTAVHSDH
jgi:hypothetical protein